MTTISINNNKDLKLTVLETDNRCVRCSNGLADLVKKNLVPVFLISAVLLGALVPQIGRVIDHPATKFICVALIFLYSGLYLQTSAIKQAIKSYRSWIWGIFSIIVVTSIVSGQLTMSVHLDTTQTNNGNVIDASSFQTGLVVYFCAPCTVSSGILLVTQLEGNYALAVLLTVTTNIAAIFTTPLLIKWLLDTNTDIDLDLPPILLKLSLTVLLPLTIGKLIQYIGVVREFSVVPRHKLCLKLTNLTCLSIVIMISVAESSSDGSIKALTVVSFFALVGWALLMHILWMLINGFACFILRIERSQMKCIVILASHKTAAVSIATLTYLPSEFGDKGLMAVAIVVAHISILLMDSVLISVWLYIEKRKHTYETIQD